ncbi:hypothetical protein DRN44_01505 [Thermococci archaeon]|nr:MAG: hypothetical protein DRN44_01505 [Thermococci archaeon]
MYTIKKEKKETRKSQYKTIPLYPKTYLLLKQEKNKLEENFGRKLSWDDLIFILLEFEKMLINDE